MRNIRQILVSVSVPSLVPDTRVVPCVPWKPLERKVLVLVLLEELLMSLDVTTAVINQILKDRVECSAPSSTRKHRMSTTQVVPVLWVRSFSYFSSGGVRKE